MPTHIRSGQRATQFWRFSLALYRSATVKTQMLDLQEQYAANINVLLFCFWFADSGQGALSCSELLRANELLFTWHEKITKALRQLRHSLPSRTNKMRYHGLGETILQDEIAAEQQEQTLLANHIFYPVVAKCTHAEKKAQAMQSIQAYFNMLTVSNDAACEEKIKMLVDTVFVKLSKPTKQTS